MKHLKTISFILGIYGIMGIFGLGYYSIVNLKKENEVLRVELNDIEARFDIALKHYHTFPKCVYKVTAKINIQDKWQVFWYAENPIKKLDGIVDFYWVDKFCEGNEEYPDYKHYPKIGKPPTQAESEILDEVMLIKEVYWQPKYDNSTL